MSQGQRTSRRAAAGDNNNSSGKTGTGTTTNTSITGKRVSDNTFQDFSPAPKVNKK